MTNESNRISLRLAGTIGAQRGLTYEDVRDAGAAKQACARAPAKGAAGGLSRAGADPCAGAALDPANAASCDRQLLARTSAARRSPGARACGAQRHTKGLDLADQVPRRQRSAGQFPRSASAVPRKGLFAW